ncbi:MAG: fused MFS/spermidine synthase, partial [Thiohalomonadales bacterium]
ASISTVLAAFFLGLALGSYLAEKITRNRIHNLTVYIVLEAVIGVSGLLLLPALLNIDYVFAQFPEYGASLGFKFALATSLLIIPTICMGATFPVMASILIRQKHEVGLRVGQLYSLNTVGAVLGASLAGFFFIPNWGLDGAIYIAVSINLTVVLLGLYLNKRIHLAPLESSSEDLTLLEKSKPASIEEAPLRKRALLVLFGTGFASIAVEVGWTKYLSIFTGTTIYGFAAILTIFLVGIAAGSWAIKSYLERMQRPELWMALGLVTLGLMLLFTRAGLTAIPPIYAAINHFPVAPGLRHFVKYFVVFLLLFPPTFILGALFPLNLKLYCGNLRGVRARIGKAYAVNTTASIFGSLFAGFYMIPKYGTDSLLTLMALLILVFPLLFVPTLKTTLSRAMVLVTALLVLGLNWVVPHINYEDLISSVQYDDDAYAGKEPKYLFLKEGKAGVISMVTYDDKHVKLQNNGLNESFIDLYNDANVLIVESLLGLMPYLLHEDPKNAFVVGFGGGITTRALTFTQGLESIKVVELEPAVVEAGRAILNGEIPALQDPRVSLSFNDARNTLLLDNTRYDIIAAQPSHPWLARASNLFTKEFFAIVDSRLNDNGIYGQWLNLFNMDATTMRSILQAFYGVFPHGLTMANVKSGDFLMFGSRQKIIFDYDRMRKRMAEPMIKLSFNYAEIFEPKDLFWYFALSRDQAVAAAGDIVANSDTNILSEVRLSKLYGDAEGDENPYTFLFKHYTLAMSSYIDGDKEQKLMELSEYFFSWRKDDLAKKIAVQLNEINQPLARGIQYKALWRASQYQQANKYYQQYEQWPDTTHFLQAMALADQGDYTAAYAQIDKAQSEPWKNAIKARLLYKQQKWLDLSLLPPLNDEALKWIVLGIARTDIKKAGEFLIAKVEDVEIEIPQLELLVTYYGVLHNELQLKVYSKKLAEKINDDVETSTSLLENALYEKQLARSERLFIHLQKLDTSIYELRRLRRQLDVLRSLPAGNESTETIPPTNQKI